MVHYPTRVGARVERGVKPEQGCKASHARRYDCVVAGVVRKGAQRRRDAQAVVLVENAGEASLRRANDVCLSSSRVGACASAGVDAGADVGADVGVGVGADAGVGEYDREDAREHDHGCGYGGVGSLLSFEVAVEAALVGQVEDVPNDGCVHAGVGASENEGEGMDFHECVHTTVVGVGGVHLDQDAVALVPK